MTRIKLADLADEKPVKLSVEISVRLHRALQDYAMALNGGETKGAPPPERLIPPMIERFIATDRSFAKGRTRAHAG